MKFTLKTICSLLAVVAPIVSAAGGAEDAVAPEGSDVVKLGAENFESFLKEHPLVLAEFFAPWCGHCKALGPQYVEAASILKEENIPLVQVDCTEEQQLCQEQGIRGYPTLKVFRGLADEKPYEGARQADAIAQYMIKQSQPAVTAGVSAADVETVTDAAQESVIVQVLPEGSDNKAANATFYEIANQKRDKYVFLSTSDADLVKKYDVKTPTYLVYRADYKKDEDPSIFNTAVEPVALNKFFEVESTPYFGEINGQTFQDYMDSGIPLAYLFYNDQDERNNWESKLNSLIKNSRGKVNFVGLDASKFGVHAGNLNQKEVFPLFAIHDIENNKKYGLNQDVDLSIDSIEKLVTDFIAGEAEPNVKSEEIPEEQLNAVYKLVGKTHDEIIGDDSKDVLVMYHATWCGHCKKLAPTFEELAAVYMNDEDSAGKVLIANIEATENDVNVEIEGFPTLILYPAGDKSNPVNYEGARDLEGLANFIKEHGTHKIDASALKKSQSQADDDEDVIEEEDVHDEL